MSRRHTSCLLILHETVKGQSDKVDILNGDFNARLAHFQSPFFPTSLPFYPTLCLLSPLHPFILFFKSIFFSFFLSLPCFTLLLPELAANLY